MRPLRVAKPSSRVPLQSVQAAFASKHDWPGDELKLGTLPQVETEVKTHVPFSLRLDPPFLLALQTNMTGKVVCDGEIEVYEVLGLQTKGKTSSGFRYSTYEEGEMGICRSIHPSDAVRLGAIFMDCKGSRQQEPRALEDLLRIDPLRPILPVPG